MMKSLAGTRRRPWRRRPTYFVSDARHRAPVPASVQDAAAANVNSRVVDVVAGRYWRFPDMDDGGDDEKTTQATPPAFYDVVRAARVAAICAAARPASCFSRARREIVLGAVRAAARR